MGHRAAIYCRVSTADQSCERQEFDLRAFAGRAGYDVVGIFKETGSGTKLDRAERKKVLALAQGHDALYAALGLHPIVIEHHLDDHLDRLDATLQNADTKLVAIGEIGLDLYREDPQFERQQTILDAQLRLAKRHDLPVILHSRRTHDKLAMHLKRIDVPRRGVVHGFAGSLQQAQRFIELGYKLASVAPSPIRAPVKPAM